MKKRNHPPAFFIRLVERLCTDSDVDAIIGDLHEMYEDRLLRRGRLIADAAYFLDFINLLLHGVFRRNHKRTASAFITMLNNYFVVAIRHIMRQKAHHFINVAGLTIGLTVSFVIGLYVWNELSYDRFHSKGDRIFLLPMTWKVGDTIVPVIEATSAAGPFIMENFSEVETMTRTLSQSLIINSGGKSFDESGILAVDSTFFDVFTFPLIVGNPATALRNPLSLVLTERMAEKYFGPDWINQDILSKSLAAQNKKLYQISGVAQNPPFNSQIQFDFLLSINSLPGERQTNWDNSSYTTYLVFRDGTSPATVLARIPEMLKKHVGGWTADNVEFDIIPLYDLHLRNPKYVGVDNAGDMRYIYIFSAIAVMVLTIALINYMNLSTARSLERAREVGVRRVVGAFRAELFWQFMCESFMITFVSMLFAIGATILSLPFFNTLAGKEMNLDPGAHPEWFVYLAVFMIIVTLAGGFYPALVLSGFKPAAVLKGNSSHSPSGMNMRKILVVAQFSISIVLIVSTLTIRSQLRFMSDAKVGVDKEHIVAFALDSIGRNQLSVLKKEFANTASVESVAPAASLPIWVGTRSVTSFNGQPKQIVSICGASPDYVRTTGLQLIAGRDFSPDADTGDRWEIILNESALRFYTVSAEDALGKEIVLWGRKGNVVGVVKDFHFAPLHQPIKPLLITAGALNAGFDYLLVRMAGSDLTSTLGTLETKWKTLLPESPFEYSFLDVRYANLYLTEVRLTRVMNTFATLAVFIASLGLFGLASYTILRRTKELGIRKVMGATPTGLVAFVSMSFIKMVMISFALSVPLCWFIMQSWLSNFHYHTSFNWWLVAGTGIGTVVLALLTVVYHSVEAARANPVNSLRSE